MEASEWAMAVKPGSRIAVGAGSRGIANIDVIVKAVVDFWKSRDVNPFIIPVMGSHGAATAEGQAMVLDHYGINEQRMGAPVVSSLDVVPLGTTPEGIKVMMDRQAYESDGVMLCGRVKWHTDFEGTIESGIHKMMAIGLGKWAGAKQYHCFAYRLGLETVIRSVGKVMLSSGKMMGGLAILEDAHHNTAGVYALGVDGLLEREEELLALCKSWKANIPVKELDLLILDEIGKHISGAGMDTKVVNRSVRHGANCWKDVPVIHRIYVRDLSDKSYGNACGMGMADIVNKRLVDKFDPAATWVNSLTASNTLPSSTPIHYASDRECISRIAPTVGKMNVGDVTVGWIRNTMELGEILVSENLLPELRQNPDIEVLSEPRELEYDADGNLVEAFAAEAVAH